ncbi:MAG: DUF6382 domain-containing protein [Eubacterium sp.]
MRIEYLRTANHSYMIVKEADYIFEHYEVQMILHNEIMSLLDMRIIVGDGQVEYWYDVTGMQSLEKLFSFETLKTDRLRMILQGLCSMKKQMEEYLLDDRNICFSSAMVYCDRGKDTVRFCYIPGYKQEQNGAEIRGLLEYMLQHLDHSDSDAVRMAYEVYESCVRDGFQAEECARCLNAEAEQGLREAVREVDHQEENYGFLSGQEDGRNRRKQEEEEEPHMVYRRKRLFEKFRKKRTENGGLPESVGGRDGTGLCGGSGSRLQSNRLFPESERKTVWELSYRGDGIEENIRMDKFPLLIGKDEKKVDAVLLAETVSRVHAAISEQEGELYLEDYNSTNGTYLNGRLVPMNTPQHLRRGDHIVFATEEYVLVDRRITKC